MQCFLCSLENPDENSFCHGCGGRLVAVCSACGRRNAGAAIFCGACGTRLIQDEPSKAWGGGAVSRAIVGERKQATVFFADIVGSTKLVAGLDPEEAAVRLQPTLELMQDAIEKYGGSVMQVLGDGILAFFGVPKALEAHAILACSAALYLQATSRDKGLPLRIGLHSGTILAPRTIEPRNQLPKGDAIHLANRVQSVAKPGTICLTGDTYRLIRDYCDVHELGPHLLKGFDREIELYKLIGKKPSVARQVLRSAQLNPFRGRVAEISFLKQAFTSPCALHVIGIAGPPGIGKSRLCFEFGEFCRREGARLYTAQSSSEAQFTPFQAIADLLRSFLSVASMEDAPEASRDVREKLLNIGHFGADDVAVLQDFLGFPDASLNPLSVDPRTRLSKLRGILRRVVQSIASQPALIILEDLHWLDEPSRGLVDVIAEAVARTRALLVLTFRPPLDGAWRSYSQYHELPLAELGLDVIHTLVEDLIGPDPALEEIRARICQRSGGNPFFAEELVHSVSDAALGNIRSGASSSDEGELLPATVQATIEARIDRLTDADKRTLQAAAVIGNIFPVKVLQEVVGGNTQTIIATISRLTKAEMVQPCLSDAPEHMFRHPLIREVAYKSQLKAQTTPLHGIVARALCNHYKERIDEFSGLLAYHHELAGDIAQASRYAEKAAAWVGKTDTSQAAKRWKRVVELFRNQPATDQAVKHRINACGQVINFGWRSSPGMTAQEAKPYVDEALTLARESGNNFVQTLILVGYGRIAICGGSADEYVELTQRALSLVPSSDGRAVTLNGNLSQAYCFAGLLEEAKGANTVAQQGLTRIDVRDRRILSFDVEQWIVALRARILVLRGEFGEAREWLERSTSRGATNLDPVVHFMPHLSYVEWAWATKNVELARVHAQRISDIAVQSGIPYLNVIAMVAQGLLESTAGRYEAAAECLKEALKVARKCNAGLEYEPRILADIADATFRAGHMREAEQLTQESRTCAQHRGARLAELHSTIIEIGLLAREDKGARAKVISHARELLQMTQGGLYAGLLQEAVSGANVTSDNGLTG